MTAAASPARPNSKRRILVVFTRLLAERGYDAVSIREVAEELEMSKGTIIHHFGSKDRMLEQVHSEYMKRRLGEAQLILARFDSPVDQFAALVMQNLLAMQHDHNATVAFAREIPRFASEPIMAEVRRMRREYAGLLEEIISRGMDRGVFRREDARMLTLQIFGTMNWTWTWLRIDGTWDVETLGAAFVRNMISGLDAQSPVTNAVTAQLVAVVKAAMSEFGNADT